MQSDTEKAKAIILEIVKEMGGSCHGKTRLYKAFYFSHLFFASDNFLTLGELSEWSIVNMPNGPGIDKGQELLNDLTREGYLSSKQEMVAPVYVENVYACTDKRFPCPLKKNEVESIKKAVEFVNGKTASQLSEMTHEFSNSWNHSKIGEVLNIHQDLMSGEEFGSLREMDWLDAEIEKVFGEPDNE
jgi:hypothetical protein